MELQHSVNGEGGGVGRRGWGVKKQKRKDKQVFAHFKRASCNLSSIKLLINSRVALGSLSTLPHLHKIKDARFPCHCLPIEREPFPQWGDLGPLWLTWGQSINTQPKRSASESLREKPQITGSFLWITHYAEMKSRDYTGKSRKKNDKTSCSTSCRHVPDFSSINQCCLGL